MCSQKIGVQKNGTVELHYLDRGEIYLTDRHVLVFLHINKIKRFECLSSKTMIN